MSASLPISQLLKLQTWMSSSFPTGAFTCSHGLESAIADGRIDDQLSTQNWLLAILHHGSGWNDAVLLSQAWHAVHQAQSPIASLQSLNELSLALQAGAERYTETTQLGASFLAAANAWPESQQLNWESIGSELSFPIIVGALGALHKIPLDSLSAATLQSIMSNLTWIASRLIPLGQNQALSIVAKLETDIMTVAANATLATLDDLGSCALLCDLASLQHESLNSRVCHT